MPPQSPKTIGRYDIIELVGRGGMGVLYRARDPVLERDVALKMMLVDFSTDPTARDRFQREAKAVARLQHRNVVTIHELGEADGTPYIVMEFLSGRDLDHVLKSETPLALADKLDIAIQLCDGLGYAHEQGIVHRDIKPGNVRVLEDGTVKILDFGIAKFAAMSSATQTGTIMGTASYMAPEQIMGQPVDGRADLFSTGVLLHELLSGQKPFSGDSPTAVVYQIMHVEPPAVRAALPDLPEALEEIVARALKKNPDERYSRASEMSSDLQMVKMMLDLPLNAGEPAASTAAANATGRFHATAIGMRPAAGAGGTTKIDVPIRPGGQSVNPVRPTETTAGTTGGGKTMLWVGLAAVAVIGVGAALMLSGGGASGNTAATPGTSTSAPSPGTPPTNTPPATTPSTATPVPAGGTAAAAGSGVVNVGSVPPGAKIVLNGADTGKVTPSAISLDKAPGAIELSLKGYQTLKGNLTDADLKSGAREFRLQREAGPVKLSVTGPYPFEIRQGSSVISPAAAQHDVTVKPGGGAVTARNAEYLLDMPIAVDFTRGSVEASVPVLGTLTILAADETCTILVDARDLGFPPISKKPVSAGPHTVVLRCSNGKDDSRKVTVSPGATTEVRFTR
jgi:serine/threonine-protein kinase